MRAVIYARTSTEEDSQKDALVNQVAEAKASVTNNEWTLVDIYVESKSGTTTKGRWEYTRLYDDLCTDKFDVVVIKSQDRLMRNTMDWYLFVNRLTSEGKKLYFYLENKFYTPDNALITGIKAILAEDYSRELSKKINNAHRNRQKNNGNVVLTKNTYGFRKLPDKSVVVIEEEAEIKRRMYTLCAAGYGSRTISTILKNEGITNRNGKPFSESSILRIIRSPLNKGTVVMNKTHFEFDTKKTIRVPAEEQYVYEHKVPAIVSEELWELANSNIDARVDQNSLKKSVSRIGKNPGKSCFSGKLYCGLCGEPYYRRTHRRYRNDEIIYGWECSTYLLTGRNKGKMNRPQLRKVNLDDVKGCDNVHLDEVRLISFLEKIVCETYITDKEKIIKNMVALLNKVLEDKDYASEIATEQKKKESLMAQMNTLLDKLLEGVISDRMYQLKHKELQDKLDHIVTKIKALELKDVEGVALKDRIAAIEKHLREGCLVEKATVAGMLDDIEKIMIFPTYMKIHFSVARMLGFEQGVHNESVDNIVQIEYGNFFNYRKKKKDDREIVVDMMRENPQITARQIADKLQISLSGVNYKIKALRKEGRIHFDGKGGHGKWIIDE